MSKLYAVQFDNALVEYHHESVPIPHVYLGEHGAYFSIRPLFKYGNVIADWNDEQSIKILNNLARAAPKGSKLLRGETLGEEDDNQPSLSKGMDRDMLVMTGGSERKASEYWSWFEKGGVGFERPALDRWRMVSIVSGAAA